MLSCTFLHPSCLPSYVPQCSGPQYVISLPLWTKARNVIQAMTVNHQVSKGGRSPSEPKARGGQYNKKCKVTQNNPSLDSFCFTWLSGPFALLIQYLLKSVADPAWLQQELVRSFGACSSCRRPLWLWRAGQRRGLTLAFMR